MSSTSFHPKWDWNISPTFLKGVVMEAERRFSGEDQRWAGCSLIWGVSLHTSLRSGILPCGFPAVSTGPGDRLLCLPSPSLSSGLEALQAASWGNCEFFVCSPSREGHYPVLSEIQCFKCSVSCNKFPYFFIFFMGEGRTGSCSSLSRKWKLFGDYLLLTF